MRRSTVPLFPHLHTPFPPFSPSLISLMVSVDVKHHVYLLRIAFSTSCLWIVCWNTDGKEPDSRLSLTIWDRISWSQQSKNNEVGMRSTAQIEGLYFRTTLLSRTDWVNNTGGNCHKYHFCRDKSILAATKLLSRQTNYVRRDKLVFFATSILLSRQK